MDNKEFLIVDINAIPRDLNLDAWLSLKNEGIIIWDSANYTDGVPYEPKVYNAEHTYRTIDISMLSEDERKELLKSIEK